jgi:hypothetical protein
MPGEVDRMRAHAQKSTYFPDARGDRCASCQRKKCVCAIVDTTDYISEMGKKIRPPKPSRTQTDSQSPQAPTVHDVNVLFGSEAHAKITDNVAWPLFQTFDKRGTGTIHQARFEECMSTLAANNDLRSYGTIFRQFCSNVTGPDGRAASFMSYGDFRHFLEVTKTGSVLYTSFEMLLHKKNHSEWEDKFHKSPRSESPEKFRKDFNIEWDSQMDHIQYGVDAEHQPRNQKVTFREGV